MPVSRPRAITGAVREERRVRGLARSKFVPSTALLDTAAYIAFFTEDGVRANQPVLAQPAHDPLIVTIPVWPFGTESVPLSEPDVPPADVVAVPDLPS
jgi:hypothetical protein